MKIVINQCYGGFSLSVKAAKKLFELGVKSTYKISVEKYKDLDWQYAYGKLRRNHPLLISVIEEMGEDANGECAELGVIEIPDGYAWRIKDYDGREWVEIATFAGIEEYR